MGQRLNIEISSGGDLLANAYYHWSAYTDSALELTDILVSHILKNDPPPSYDQLYAVRLLEETGALLRDKEQPYMQSIYTEKFGIAQNRNEGLIAVSAQAMYDTRDWEEGRVSIDLTYKTVDFEVVSQYSKEFFIENIATDEDDYQTLPTLSKDFDFCVKFEHFTEFSETLKNHMKQDNDCLRLDDENGDVVIFIR